MELHATLNQFRHAHCGKNTDFTGKCKRTSYMAVTVRVGHLYTGRQGTPDRQEKESSGVHEIVSEFTCLLFNRQLLHIRDLFKKERFVKRKKKIMHIV